MNKSQYFALIFMILAPLSTDARIGETMDQCKSRYGMWARLEPLSKDRVQAEFSTDKMDVVVIFFDGLCENIRYIREQGKKYSEYFDDAELRVLLDANGNGKPWGEGDKDMFSSSILEYHFKKWYTEDNSYIASYDCYEAGSLRWTGDDGSDQSNKVAYCELVISTRDSITHAQKERADSTSRLRKIEYDKAKKLLDGF